MVQIYLLSVISAVAGGCLLLSEQLKEKVPPLTLFREWYQRNSAYQPFLFFMFGIIGALSFIFPYKGIPVLGDFIPSITNILIGCTLFLEYYKEKGRVVSDTFQKIITLSEQYQGAFGAIALITGIAHFLFPGVIFI